MRNWSVHKKESHAASSGFADMCNCRTCRGYWVLIGQSEQNYVHFPCIDIIKDCKPCKLLIPVNALASPIQPLQVRQMSRWHELRDDWCIAYSSALPLPDHNFPHWRHAKCLSFLLNLISQFWLTDLTVDMVKWTLLWCSARQVCYIIQDIFYTRLKSRQRAFPARTGNSGAFPELKAALTFEYTYMSVVLCRSVPHLTLQAMLLWACACLARSGITCEALS